MGEPDWYRDDEALLEQMRECHRSDTPRPTIRGYGELLPLERGGQGTVFLASEESSGRRVALKVFHEQSFETSAGKRRFEREIYLVSRLEHPNVVRLHRFGQTLDGRPFLAMEYVAGLSFDEYVEHCSVDEILALMIQLSDALDHAHRRGVIHRDLKPGNVRVDREGNARLLDFGLAKPTRQAGNDDPWNLSATGQFLGSLRWASPEQLSGHPDDVDTRTDIYSLGLLLFHSLTGRVPYDVEGSVADIAQNIAHTAPERLSRQRPDVSADIETIVLRCLAKEPSRRYATMGELARDLLHALEGEPIAARRDGVGYVLRSLGRKHPAATATLIAGLLALIGFSAITTRYYLRARAAERASQVALAEKEVALIDREAALADKQAEVEKVAAVNEFLLGSFLGSGVPPAQLGDLRLQDVLAQAAPRIETTPNLAARPQVRADLHVAFAFWFSVLPDKWDEATEHANEALRLYGTAPGSPAVQRAWAHEVRGDVSFARGNLRAAREDFRAATDLYRTVPGARMNIARCLWRNANCALALEELDGARALLAECLELHALELGPKHRRTEAIERARNALLDRLDTR